jgi:uncharacterized membrane protein YhaH (DUF805 family)
MGQIDVNKLWQNFVDTVTRHYMDFSGRVGRTQYWYFILVCVGLFVVAAILGVVVGRGLLAAALGLALLLPIGGLSARRVQDVGQNGSLVWIWVAAAGVEHVLTILHAVNPPTVQFSLTATGVTYSNGYGAIDSLVGLVAFAASIALIYFCAQPGDAAANAYGPPPAPWSPSA